MCKKVVLPEVGACCLRTVSDQSRLCLLLRSAQVSGLGRMRLTPKVSLDPALSSAEAFQPVTTKTQIELRASCDFLRACWSRGRK